jgi:hypothetical protein
MDTRPKPDRYPVTDIERLVLNAAAAMLASAQQHTGSLLLSATMSALQCLTEGRVGRAEECLREYARGVDFDREVGG